jgi:hypothetical protein
VSLGCEDVVAGSIFLFCYFLVDGFAGFLVAVLAVLVLVVEWGLWFGSELLDFVVEWLHFVPFFCCLVDLLVGVL